MADVTLTAVAGSMADVTVSAIDSTPSGYAILGWQGGESQFIATTADGRQWRASVADALGGRLAGLAGGESGWIAVTEPRGGGATAQPWLSSDGRTWRPLQPLPWLDPGYGAVVAAGPRGYVILGQVERSGTPVPTGAVSPDGVTWTEVPTLGDGAISGIVATDAGYAAFGPNDLQLSADLKAWHAVQKIAGGPLDFSERGSLTSWTGTQVLFLGVGSDKVVRGWLGTVTFGAAPHVDWRAIDSAIFAGAGIVAAATSPDRLLVLGYSRVDLGPIAWTLAGGTWRRTALAAGTFGGGVPDQVAGSSAGFVAVGTDVGPTGQSVSTLWRSDDGSGWSRVADQVLGVLPAAPTGPCPAPSSTTLDDLLTMSADLWQVCFAGERLTIEGYVTQCDGCGGAGPYTGQPAWLNPQLAYGDFWLSRSASVGDGSGAWVSAWIDPARPITIPAMGTHVRVVGHFNDPASSSCRLIPDWGIAAVPPAAQVEAGCRSRFVLESLQVLTP